MRSTPKRSRFHGWILALIAVGLSLGLIPATLRQSRAAQMSSTIQLDAAELDHPILLNQKGQTIRFSTNRQAGPVNLTNGALPRYVAYPLDSGDLPPKGFPTVVSDSGKSGQTGTGPLHLIAQVKAELDQTLAKDGQAAVYNGQNTYLVKPLPPLFGTAASPGGTTLAWIASQRDTGSSGSGSAQAGTATATAPVQAQTLIPSSITDPITNSRLVKDLEHLLMLKSGKLVNWNQQTLDALKSDLDINSPKNVATKDLASTSKPQLEAQVIDGIGSAGTPQPAPVPEPGTIVVFGLVAASLAVRKIQAGRQ
jgi:hypothetical protein